MIRARHFILMTHYYMLGKHALNLFLYCNINSQFRFFGQHVCDALIAVVGN